mmetsp:Transcript_26584/g.30415  ORF Transcript_26584/g.30415 Transcript_26584/m.30415 type:complete len:227 (+) Transcript_26584:207-887(+)
MKKGSLSITYCFCIVSTLAANQAVAFVGSSKTHSPVPPVVTRKCASSSALFAEQGNKLMSRNEMIWNTVAKSTAILTTVSTSLTFIPSPAFADVTNKVASQASLRYIKRSVKELEKLELYASTNDYSEIKQGLRSPALSEIRKNANVLIKGGDDTSEAETLTAIYATFIKDIEKLDSNASLGFRGKKGVELYPSYQKAMKGLMDFQASAERSVTVIPIVNEVNTES